MDMPYGKIFLTHVYEAPFMGWGKIHSNSA